MNLLRAFSLMLLLLCFGCTGVFSQPVENWAIPDSYQVVDLTGEDGNETGYRITAPVLPPAGMVRGGTGNETFWTVDAGDAGEFLLMYLPVPGTAREDEFFRVHERDVSFLGEVFHEENLGYDGSVYSCWGETGEGKIRYDCGRFITGAFFRLSADFDSWELALRHNLRIREIISTIRHSSS